jgi:DNA polymerase-3 subunit beta
MIIEINKNQLIEPLKNIIGVSEQKQAMPILGNILFKVQSGSLLLVASDLEVEVSYSAESPGLADFETTVPSRKFFDILRSLDTEQVKLEFLENKVVIKGGKSKFTVSTLPAAGFPYKSKEAGHNHKVSVKMFEKLIAATAFSMGHQDARHFLNGLFFEIRGDRITAVATDGHRLAMAAIDQKNEANEPTTCIIPRKCIVELKKILTTFSDNKEKIAEFSVNNKEFSLKIEGYTLTSKLIEGNYPDYKKVFPESLPNTLTVDKQSLKLALQRMSILSSEQYRGVKLSIDKAELRLSATNPMQEQGEDIIPCQYTGEHIEVGFNLNYIIEVIDAIASEELKIMLNTTDSGCLISPGKDEANSKYIIMPMRI